MGTLVPMIDVECRVTVQKKNRNKKRWKLKECCQYGKQQDDCIFCPIINQLMSARSVEKVMFCLIVCNINQNVIDRF